MKKIYFIGINGIGMSGLAKIMKIKGYDVIGADVSRSYVTESLEKIGITVYSEHNARNMEEVDTVIASSAIKESNPEYSYAIKNNIKIIKRGELLAELLNKEIGIAVAGTHGKTTTSSMLGAAILSKDPTLVIGGILPEIGSNAKPGLSKYFVAEADESDNSFLFMKPTYSIITNIEADHLENHGSLENIKKSFSKFMDQTTKEIIVCNDCPNIRELIKNRKNIVTYSIKTQNVNIYSENIIVKNGKTSYNVIINNKNIGRFSLSVPGEHNIANSLPVIYLANKFKVEDIELKNKILAFKGAKRRYDVLYDNQIKIIDDYAHHPTEIKATIQAAKSIETQKIVGIFQPHRYSRVNFLLEEFEQVFHGIDELYILPIYSAGEKNIYDISLEKLKNKIGHSNTQIILNTKEIEEYIYSKKEKQVYIFMGAGDISKLAHKIADNLEVRI
ncbi:MAG: UDP-N-acetylmuramate--L-alanine ligase [Fusobacteriaceae bacterium]